MRCKIIEKYRHVIFELSINLKPVTSDDILEPNTLKEVNLIIQNIHEELKFMADEIIRRENDILIMEESFDRLMEN